MDHITVDHCRADISYIIMHDVNIEEKTKCEILILALLLFSSLSIKILSNISPRQLIMLRGIGWLAQLKR